MHKLLIAIGATLWTQACFQPNATSPIETDATDESTTAPATATDPTEPGSSSTGSPTSIGGSTTGPALPPTDSTSTTAANDGSSSSASSGPSDSTDSTDSTGESSGNEASCVETDGDETIITFGELPNGALVNRDTPLEGDEFDCAGLIEISGVGRGACPDELGAEIVVASSCTNSATGPFLRSYDPDDPSSCTGGGLRFRFSTPLDSIRVEFAGASVDYELLGYFDGVQVASALTTGECNDPAVSVALDPAPPMDEVVFLRVEDVNAFHNIRSLAFVTAE